MQPTTSIAPATAAERAPSRRARRVARWLLVGYGIVLAAIAFWPVPVDSGSRAWLDAISAAVPWLSYDVIEVTANVLLFVPLGVLFALVLPRRRWLVLPIALAISAVIELVQGLFLDQRTSSLSDMIANFSGAVIGLLVVILVKSRRSRAR